MKRILGVSCVTVFLIASLGGAGASGTLGSEMTALESEVARAQNERDALLLKSGKGKDDPAVQAKTEALEQKKKDLRERMKDLNTHPKADAADDREASRGSVSAEGIQGEIAYPKKGEPKETVAPADPGLSEIQYPKKRKTGR